MAYDNLISRGDVQALIPEEVSNRWLTGETEMSAAMRLFQRVPMGTNQQRMPVMSAFPVAYFVGGDTGLKQTTEMAWANKYLNVEEIAVIVPIPEAVVEDANFSLEDAVMPRLEESIGRTLDAAVFFGTNKPASWPEAIVPAAIAAGNVYNVGTNNTAAGGIAEDFNQLYTLIEADGFDVNGMAASRAIRGRLRGARNAQGDRQDDEISTTAVYGAQLAYVMRGLWPTGAGSALAIPGDYSQGILGIRRDITMRALTEAAIFDDAGNLIYNLPQQDMVAIRVTFRVAYQVSNLLNYDNITEATRWPFGVLRVAP